MKIKDNLKVENEERLKFYQNIFNVTENHPTYKEFFASIFYLIGERGDYLSINDPCVALMHPLNTLQ